MREKPFVATDMDGVVAALVPAVVAVFNRRHAKQHGAINAEWREYRIEKQFQRPPISDLIYGIMHEPGFFAAIEPYEGAGQALRELGEVADIEICSSPPLMEIGGRKTLNAYVAADKIGWLFRHFHDQALAADVTLTLKKARHHADVLIDDDAIGNVIPWALAHHDGLGYVVARAWNDDLAGRGVTVPVNVRRGTFAEAPRVIREWWATKVDSTGLCLPILAG